MKYIKIPTNFIHIGLNTKKLLQVNNYLTFAVAYCGKVTTTMTSNNRGPAGLTKHSLYPVMNKLVA